MIYNVANQKYTINKQVKEDIETLKNNDEVFKEDIATVTVALNNKADKQTEGGGFIAGEILLTEDNKAYTGVSIGKNAKTYGGVNIGKEAYGSVGAVAIGDKAKSTMGASIGDNSFSNSGGAVGYEAYTTSGGAIGYKAKAGKGFSGGAQATVAETGNNSEKYIDAIQLGKGTNSIPKTLQIYDYQLLDANGKIPNERFEITGQIGDTITTARKIRKTNDTEWLPCDGREILKNEYANAYDIMPNVLLSSSQFTLPSAYAGRLLTDGNIICYSSSNNIYYSLDNTQTWQVLNLAQFFDNWYGLEYFGYTNGYWVVGYNNSSTSDYCNIAWTKELLNNQWQETTTGFAADSINNVFGFAQCLFVDYSYSNVRCKIDKIDIDTLQRKHIYSNTSSKKISNFETLQNNLIFITKNSQVYEIYQIDLEGNTRRKEDISKYITNITGFEVDNIILFCKNNECSLFVPNTNIFYYGGQPYNEVILYNLKKLNLPFVMNYFCFDNINEQYIFMSNNWFNNTREPVGSITKYMLVGTLINDSLIYGAGSGNSHPINEMILLNNEIIVYSSGQTPQFSRLTKTLPKITHTEGLQTYIRVK